MNFIKKTISCEDKYYTIVVLIQTYILMKITSWFSDKFLLYLIINVLLLYAPLEKNVLISYLNVGCLLSK